MLNYPEAIEKILKHSVPLKFVFLPIRECLGLTVAKDLISPEPFPAFDNSAVDGYATCGRKEAKVEQIAKYEVIGEVPAGQYLKKVLKPGQAVRIFTGAPIPRGAKAVVMQENVDRINGSIALQKNPSPGDNIRFRGEDFQKGRVLVRRGASLEPAHLALLAAVGYKRIPVFSAPKVAILATGSELLEGNQSPKPGMIRDSNTLFLEALVKKAGGIPMSLSSVKDDPSAIRASIRKGLKADLFLISGGVSVGKYDFVKELLRQAGVKQIFWKVNIKPGKPLFFGKNARTLVFGLPGNPVSVYVTFEAFVKPALFKMQGKKKAEERWVKGRLTRPFQNGPRFHFVRVLCTRRPHKKEGWEIMPLTAQGSHMIGGLASANGLLQVEANAKLKRNQQVMFKFIREED